MPIDFDISNVFNEHNIQILQKVTPLDLRAQVAGSLGDNQRLYSVPTVCINSIVRSGSIYAKASLFQQPHYSNIL